MFLANGCGVYGIENIVFDAIMFPILALGLFFTLKYVKEEKHIKLVIKITAGVLLALIITNRIAYTLDRLGTSPETSIYPDDKYGWSYLLPETFCGLSALSLSIVALVGKKNNILFHSLAYFAFANATISAVYPVYLNKQIFFEVGTVTSLIYHIILIYISVVIIVKKYMTPTIKRWYVPPLTYVVFVLIALFEVQVLGTPHMEAMSIFEPLVSGTGALTMWYTLGIVVSLVIIIFLFLYEHFYNKKSFKTILLEMKP